MIIKRIEIQNFKTFENRSVEFNEKTPNLICGRNGTGKSTVLEAILWCFGQDKRLDYIEQIVNNNALEKTNEESSVNVIVSVFCLDMDNHEYKVERINTYKKCNSKPLLINESLTIYRIHKNEIERKLQTNELVEKLAKNILKYDSNNLSNFAQELIRFISNKYNVNINTASSILSLVVKNSNVIFSNICKKTYLRIKYENKRIDLSNEEGTCYPGSMSENCECINAILLSLKEFDNDVCLMIDEPLVLDDEDYRLFINYISKIEYQVISTTNMYDVECYPELNEFVCCNVEKC